MYDKIKKIIVSKKNDIDETTLEYFCNYFTVVVNRNVIPGEMELDELIDNVLRIGKIEFFKDDSDIVKKYGNSFKGLRDSQKGILYVRDSLPEELKEITIYHEIHHAAQTSEKMLESQKCGINQEENFGRMIMEAQTQWFAEEIYKTIHNVSFDERMIPSEELRMQSGQTICSALHNYEMYDAMLSKLSIIMSVPKEYFVELNYLYKDNAGIDKLKNDYEQKMKEKKLPVSFISMMKTFDYAYVVDLLGYIDNEDRDVILSGGETINLYEIYKNFGMKLSHRFQAGYIKNFDDKIIMALRDNGIGPNSDFEKYSKYIFFDKTRELVQDFMESQNNDHKPKQ